MTQLVIIGIYLGMLLCLGLFSSRLFKGTSKDYMLASHSIGPFLLLMSIFGTTMTAFALVGSSGEAYKEGVGVYGMLASSSGIIHSLCFFLLGIKLWSWGHKHGYTTQIQFFRDRLESDRIGIILFPVLVGLVIPYLLIGVMASGVVISSITEGAFESSFAAYDYGIPPWLGSLVISMVVLIYVFFGGMRGTAWANTFQTVVFMILGVVTFVVISNKLGGLEAASNAVLEKNPSKLMRDVAPADRERYSERYTSWVTMAKYNYVTKVAKTLTLTPDQKEEAYQAFKPRMPNWQTKAQAVYAAKNKLYELTSEEINKAMLIQDDRVMPDPFPEKWKMGLMTHHDLKEYPRKANAEKEKSMLIFGGKIGHPEKDLDPNDPSKGKKWTIKKARGVYRASNWAPDAPHPMSKLVFLTYFFVPLSVGMFPHLFQHWLTARSAATFKLPVVAHPLFIMVVWVPCVLVGVWATSATLNGAPMFPPHFPANAVLAAMVKKMTSPVLAGFLTAGILAAIMSSLDSQFLCLGTMFTEDIVVHYGGKDRFTDQQVVLMARLFIILIVAITYGFSLLEPRRVFTLGVWCFSGFSSLFPIIFAAVYWKKLTKAGAYAGILVAIGSWLYLFREAGYALKPNYTFLGMMPVATMVVCSAVAMILVSLITKPPSKETMARFYPED
ncbi:MAG: sodium:solute symporter family protein [Planctomycetes bacterium]|nr:sodium:solute symporter family protein [Planctomycetota bacterium]MCH9725499.1 sodium:solute symporter family protein [Planctomycetota bacterium]MCH9779030.1 sodium:solute symporter family protein [Planctomycetota bacterium]MCH9790512.1 sodium:solute symporter family protein [Planctomycetota bacterium]